MVADWLAVCCGAKKALFVVAVASGASVNASLWNLVPVTPRASVNVVLASQASRALHFVDASLWNLVARAPQRSAPACAKMELQPSCLNPVNHTNPNTSSVSYADVL